MSREEIERAGRIAEGILSAWFLMLAAFLAFDADQPWHVCLAFLFGFMARSWRG